MPRRLTRNARASTGLATLLVGSIVLAGCGQSAGRALAAEACRKVRASLKLGAQASDGSPARSRALRSKALIELDEAEPLAAIAAGEDPEWQALRATLAEAGQVPERYLVSALRAQCSSPTGDG